MISFETLETLVLGWARDRKILDNSNSKTQLLKTMSELGELADAIIKQDAKGIKDGIGDVLVTLALVAWMEGGLDLTECLEHAYEEIKDRKGYLNENGVFVKEV